MGLTIRFLSCSEMQVIEVVHRNRTGQSWILTYEIQEFMYTGIYIYHLSAAYHTCFSRGYNGRPVYIAAEAN